MIWNLDRFYRNDSPQFDAPAAALARGRVSIMSGYRKIDDRTVEIETSRPISYLPYLLTWILFTSPQSYAAAGNDWGKVAAAGAAGTGPFRITRFVPRQSAELSRNDGYWNPDRKPKLDRILLLPMPEANTRLAALRSGQVDWIEVPPPDAIPSLKAGRLPGGDQFLPACLALGLRRRQAGQPGGRCPRPPGAELLHRPRRHAGPAERHGGAERRLLQGERSFVRCAGEPLQARRRPRARR